MKKILTMSLTAIALNFSVALADENEISSLEFNRTNSAYAESARHSEMASKTALPYKQEKSPASREDLSLFYPANLQRRDEMVKYQKENDYNSSVKNENGYGNEKSHRFKSYDRKIGAY